MTGASKPNSDLVYSYLEHRKAIGWLGVSLPIVLILGELIIFQTGIQSSLSSYYYTQMRGVFVGTLWAIGFFLLSYKGSDKIDDIAGNLACVFAVGISLFPTSPGDFPKDQFDPIGTIHLVFAALFFGTLIYFSYFLFTKSNLKNPREKKLLRNTIYRICGVVMAVCIILCGIYFVIPGADQSAIAAIHPVTLLETIAIWAFGFSWLVKGEAIAQLNDSGKA